MRRTSLEVYKQIEAEGLLSRLRFLVYCEIFHYGPCTALELYQRRFRDTHRDHSITPRFSELEKLGVIEATGESICKVSGRNVIIWDVTDRLPIKLEKPKRYKCHSCNGKGYFKEQQSRMI